MAGPPTQIKFTSDQAFIAALQAELEALGDDVSVLGTRREEDPTALGFDFGLLVALVALVNDACFEEPMAKVILRAIKRERPRAIRIDTPLGTTTFEPRADMTADEIRAMVLALARAQP